MQIHFSLLFSFLSLLAFTVIFHPEITMDLDITPLPFSVLQHGKQKNKLSDFLAATGGHRAQLGQ